MIEPDLLISAYASGWFPMAVEGGEKGFELRIDEPIVGGEDDLGIGDAELDVVQGVVLVVLSPVIVAGD